MSARSVMIFDSAATGHHGEWLRLIASEQREAQGSGQRIHMVCHPDVSIPPQRDRTLQVIRLTPEEVGSLSGNALRRAVKECRIARKYAEELKAERVIFLHLNRLLYAINWVFARTACDIRGILFSPMPLKGRSGAGNRKHVLMRWRKLLQLRVLLALKKVTRIYVLNDTTMVSYLNKALRAETRFRMLPDPLNREIVRKAEEMQPRPEPGIKKGATLLLFGSFNERKGVQAFLNGLLHYVAGADAGDGDHGDRLVLHIAGLFSSPVYRGKCLSLIKEIRARAGKVEIILEEGYVSQERSEILFRESDYVVVPYINFHGSSGVLGVAAAMGKPVIASRDGLVGELVERHGLGKTVNCQVAAEVAASIRSALAGEVVRDIRKSRQWVDSLSGVGFVEELLN